MSAGVQIPPVIRLAAYSIKERQTRDVWKHVRRPEQAAPPGDWSTWLVMAGRGFGKTRTGAEWVREQVMQHGAIRIALIGPTAADARDVMVEGESGLLACCERYGIHAKYKSSKRRVEFPNGALAFLYSAEEPDRLRGPQHHRGWGDEIAAWDYPETWDQLQFGLRLGAHPQSLATTTPKPVHIVRSLLKAAESGDVIVTRGSTYDNAANLSPAFLATIRAKYEGTRLGRQEIAGELLSDVEGALWSYALIDQHRIETIPAGVSLPRIVVAVDPPATSGSESAECGIAVAGFGSDGRGYVLDDRSVRGTPNEWARAAVKAFDDYRADHVIIETNQGGEMATNTLRTVRDTLPIRDVHASRGKYARAEPVSALYEQGRISHVGTFPTLEDQLATWVPDGRQPSPDRLDALVWAFTDLMLQGGGDFAAITDDATLAALQSMGIA